MRIAFGYYRSLRAVLGLVTVLVSLASCSAPATPVPPTPTTGAASPTMTFTLHEDSCTYEGPRKVPLGKITVNLKDDGRDYAQYAVVIATLDAGKSIDDINRAPANPEPSWVHQVNFLGSLNAGSSFTYTIDLKEGMTDDKQDPIYLVCFTAEPVKKVGAVGPIEVGK